MEKIEKKRGGGEEMERDNARRAERRNKKGRRETKLGGEKRRGARQRWMETGRAGGGQYNL